MKLIKVVCIAIVILSGQVLAEGSSKKEFKKWMGDSVREGEIFIAMHYVETNRLTHPGVDPYSRQPSYKHCAVRLEPVDA